MSSLLVFIFCIILFLIWIIAGGFITEGSVLLRKYRNRDEDLHFAYTLTVWASCITWVLVALFIGLFILGVTGVVGSFSIGVGELAAANVVIGGKTVKTGISWFILLCFIVSFILVVVTGVLSTIAAINIAKSANYSSDIDRLKRSYNDCVIAAVMSLGALFIIVAGGITYLVVKSNKKKQLNSIKTKKLTKV